MQIAIYFVNLIKKRITFIMETVSINKILQLFNRLPKADQLEIAERINKQTFEERWQSLDNQMPNSMLSEEEIMTEVRAVRYDNKKA